MTPLLLLAEKVEGLSGPDREVDILIELALGLVPAPYERAVSHGAPQMYFWDREDSHAPYVTPERYTSSVDAAMALVPEGCFVGDLSQCDVGGEWYARIASHGEVSQDAVAATPALALVAASLRARAAMEAGE